MPFPYHLPCVKNNNSYRKSALYELKSFQLQNLRSALRSTRFVLQESEPFADAGRSPDVDAAPDVVLGLVERLRGFQDARAEMRSFQDLVDTSVVPKYRPLVGAIASDCARRSSRRTDPTPQDYVYKSTGLKDLLRGGLR